MCTFLEKWLHIRLMHSATNAIGLLSTIDSSCEFPANILEKILNLLENKSDQINKKENMNHCLAIRNANPGLTNIDKFMEGDCWNYQNECERTKNLRDKSGPTPDLDLCGLNLA